MGDTLSEPSPPFEKWDGPYIEGIETNRKTWSIGLISRRLEEPNPGQQGLKRSDGKPEAESIDEEACDGGPMDYLMCAEPISSRRMTGVVLEDRTMRRIALMSAPYRI